MFDSKGISLRRIVWCVSLVILAVLVLPWSRFYFTDLGVRWLYILLFSFSLSAILTPVMRLIALKLNIVDVPGGRKIHEKTTPLLGGVAILIAFNTALLANMVLERDVIFLLCGGIIVAMMGLVDDWRGVSARLKLFVQIFIVLVLIYVGIVLNLFPRTVWGYWLNVLFTILWIIGITNAMNFIDGMDGLAAGIGAIIAMFMGIVAFQTDQPFMGWIAIAMMGSCLGFLPFNFGLKRPASIYLGDAGSTFIGFMLAALAIKGNWADNSRIVSFSVPVLIFWILIYDMAYITIERIVTGKVKSLKQWIDYVGTDHIHHRLYNLLGDRRKAVLFIYFLCATLGISAITLRYARPIDGMLLVVQAFLITIIVSIAEYSGRNR
ncbi:MAG: MraY family glycosyltransferase [Thermodesulfobacteriota bacterium]|nr:MraY family glycosyltransferase [Thermodesulfobacteriota bacterium]